MIDIKKLQDPQLIKRIQKKNCNDSIKELIERHSLLCFSVFKRYLPTLNFFGVLNDEIYAEKDHLIWKSALNFNPNKGSRYSTWLANCCRYKCLTLINQRREIPTECSKLDDLIDNDTSSEPTNKYLFHYVNNILDQITDKRIKKIYIMRYFSDKAKPISWRAIGRKLKISSQTVINLHARFLPLLKSKLESKSDLDFI